MSLNKFCAALGSIHNENTLALANINFDFALFKCDAPKEFHGLGNSLSDKRRIAAESGTAHRIARKLGALSEQVLPTAPELIAAYGRRVSEISQVNSVNPRGNNGDGPFAEQMGADGTAIWAAATSGPSAMPVLMLACMLARIWSGPEATSLWAEIISQRQEEIRTTCDGTRGSDFASLQAMQQEFSRTQLAEWDASVRAWLRSADEARMRDQRQLMLILNNVNLPVSSNLSVYNSVLDTWKTAMVSMDNLVKGVPQRVQCGALLLGLSAWHLYPDMVVYGKSIKEIRYNDSLVSIGGILTVGLQNDENNDQGVYWSLPLAHLRYYGHPVKSTRAVSQDVSRVSMDQLAQVALGAVLSAWGNPATEVEILNQAQWFSNLYDFLSRAASVTDAISAKCSSETRVLRRKHKAMDMLRSPGWLSMLMNAANRLVSSTGAERESSIRLTAFGQRRCGRFLAEMGEHPQPFFGLSDPSNILCMLHNSEHRIAFLRAVAEKFGLDKKYHIIRYQCKGDEETWYEYASTSPLPFPSRKRDGLGNQILSFSHGRWISMKRRAEIMQDIPPQFACGCINSCEDSKEGCCPCSKYQGGCSQECLCCEVATSPTRNAIGCRTNASLLERQREVKDRDRHYREKKERTVIQYLSEGFDPTGRAPVRRLPQPRLLKQEFGIQTPSVSPDVFHNTWQRKHDIKSKLSIALKSAPWVWDKDDEETMTLQKLNYWFGDERAAIFYLESGYKGGATLPDNALDREDYTEIFRQDALDIGQLDVHLHTQMQNHIQYALSLKALASAEGIYKLLPNATVDLRVTSSPLYATSWVSMETDSHSETHQRFNFELSRCRTFACIAHFESGSFNIDPQLLKDVMAMSSGNSIFVAATLLCDPFEKPAEYEIRRVVGNVGRAGLAMLIPPQDPKIRTLAPDTWNLINHAPFDGKLEVSFQSTSLHLSFTPYTMAINTGDHGSQDKEAFFVETVVSVYDQNKWIGDLNVLKTVSDPFFSRHKSSPGCTHIIDEDTYEYEQLVCFDTWEEILDREDMSGVVRAHGNWLARLATAAVSVQKGYPTVILPSSVCWECVGIDGVKGEIVYIC